MAHSSATRTSNVMGCVIVEQNHAIQRYPAILSLLDPQQVVGTWWSYLSLSLTYPPLTFAGLFSVSANFAFAAARRPGHVQIDAVWTRTQEWTLFPQLLLIYVYIYICDYHY